ncbi:MAG: toll/interleukin-1 receptor domain-containing protein [Lachnospiraceae bacterium]|nr:toll/interleukin-1 receptor domain-containing protein [Lachnospiraceae bacterium]
MSIEALNCQCCGAPLKIAGSLCECEYCSSINVIGGAAGKYIAQLNRANKLRQQCEFDPAYNIYENILSENTPSVDVLWSQALCEYGIEYVPDPVSSRYFPTLHRIKDISFLNSRCFLEALELADDEQKKQLNAAAEEIERIQRDYLNIAANERPYDAFICYKETDIDSGEMTEDVKLAEELYNELTKYGFKVFFARETLKDKLSVNYEPYIFAALKSAKAMAVIGTRAEYFTSVWVKNEWGRFLKLMEEHPDKKMFFACDNPEDMPRAFAYKQAQLLGEEGAIKNLAANIVRFLSGNAKTGKETVKPKIMKPLLTQEEYDGIMAGKAKEYANRLPGTRYGETEKKIMQEMSDSSHTADISGRLYTKSFHAGSIMLIAFELLHIIYAATRISRIYGSSTIFFNGIFNFFLSILFFAGLIILLSPNVFLNIFSFKEKGSAENISTIVLGGFLLFSVVSFATLFIYAFFPYSDTILMIAIPILILALGLIRGSNRSFAINKKIFENAASRKNQLKDLEEAAKNEFFEYDAKQLEEMKENYINVNAEIKDYHYDEVEKSVLKQIEDDTRYIVNMRVYVLETPDQIQKRNIFAAIYSFSALIFSLTNIMIFMTSGAYANLFKYD